MTRTEALILEMLACEHEPIYGRDVVRRSNGRVTHGAVYVVLSNLHSYGYIYIHRESEKAPYTIEGVIMRHKYSITQFGRYAIKSYLEGQAVSQLTVDNDVSFNPLITPQVSGVIWTWFEANKHKRIKLKWGMFRPSFKISVLAPLIERIAGPQLEDDE